MPYVGEIRMWAGTFKPAGWELCNGQLLPISENDTLFVVIGTTYGGDGESTFALPNLQSRIPLHQGNGFVLGEMAGTEQETITVQRMPAHTHPFLATTALGTEGTPGGNVPAQSATHKWWTGEPPLGPLSPVTVGSAGGSQPHDNMHPFLTLTFIISLFGVFPSAT